MTKTNDPANPANALRVATGFAPCALRCLLAMACQTAAVVAQGDAAALTEDQRAVFALIDEFDALDTRKLPFVVVVSTQDGRRWERYGFLESSTSRSFGVRYLDLGRDVLEVSKEKEGRPGVHFEPTDLRVAVARAIDRGRNRSQDSHGFHFYMVPEQPASPDVVMLLLARACAQNGLLAEVNSLWQVLPKEYLSREGLTGDSTADLALALDHRLELDFTDPRLGWADLLARHEKWLSLFPNHYLREFVAERRDRLEEFLATQRRRTGAPRSSTPSPADLVFDLHDEFHADLSNLYFDAAAVSCPEPRPPQGQRPTDRLIALDLDAVPALIDALDDKSPTRTIVYSSRFGGGFSVQSVAELAESTLIEIAGWGPGSRGDAAPWRDWYARAKRDGIRKLLTEGVIALDPRAVAGFLRRWPKELGVVLAAVREHGTSGAELAVFHLLLGSAVAPRDERVLALGAEVAGKSKEWHQQLYLAELLLQCGSSGGVAPVLATWRTGLDEVEKAAPSPKENPEKYLEWMEWQSQRIDVGRLLGFLVQSGDLTAWRAIAEACSRSDVRRSLAARLVAVSWATARQRVEEPELAEVESQFRKCLAQLLADDAHAFSGARFKFGDREIVLHDASCADIAACVLAASWPKEFAFDAARTGTVRHRQILTLRGKPAEPSIPRAPEAGETAEQGLVRANRLTKVTIDASAAALDAAVKDRIRALLGTPLNAESLITVAISTAATARGHGVSFRCERTGEGDGTSLTVTFRSLEGEGVQSVCSGPDEGGGWGTRLLVTAGGVQLGYEALGVTSGKLERIQQLEEHGKYVGPIEKSLSAPARTGVEITLVLQSR